jgi:hypothetical protein
MSSELATIYDYMRFCGATHKRICFDVSCVVMLHETPFPRVDLSADDHIKRDIKRHLVRFVTAEQPSFAAEFETLSHAL